MASEMVERVAKAIDPDAFEGCSHGSKGPCLMCAEDVDLALYRARAAIEAMREPTEAMGGAGREIDNYVLRTVESVWQAMIDEALKE